MSLFGFSHRIHGHNETHNHQLLTVAIFCSKPTFGHVYRLTQPAPGALEVSRLAGRVCSGLSELLREEVIQPSRERLHMLISDQTLRLRIAPIFFFTQIKIKE